MGSRGVPKNFVTFHLDTTELDIALLTLRREFDESKQEMAAMIKRLDGVVKSHAIGTSAQQNEFNSRIEKKFTEFSEMIDGMFNNEKRLEEELAAMKKLHEEAMERMDGLQEDVSKLADESATFWKHMTNIQQTMALKKFVPEADFVIVKTELSSLSTSHKKQVEKLDTTSTSLSETREILNALEKMHSTTRTHCVEVSKQHGETMEVMKESLSDHEGRLKKVTSLAAGLSTVDPENVERMKSSILLLRSELSECQAAERNILASQAEFVKEHSTLVKTALKNMSHSTPCSRCGLLVSTPILPGGGGGGSDNNNNNGHDLSPTNSVSINSSSSSSGNSLPKLIPPTVADNSGLKLVCMACSERERMVQAIGSISMETQSLMDNVNQLANNINSIGGGGGGYMVNSVNSSSAFSEGRRISFDSFEVSGGGRKDGGGGGGGITIPGSHAGNIAKLAKRLNLSMSETAAPEEEHQYVMTGMPFRNELVSPANITVAKREKILRPLSANAAAARRFDEDLLLGSGGSSASVAGSGIAAATAAGKKKVVVSTTGTNTSMEESPNLTFSGSVAIVGTGNPPVYNGGMIGGKRPQSARIGKR